MTNYAACVCVCFYCIGKSVNDQIGEAKLCAVIATLVKDRHDFCLESGHFGV